MTFFTSNVVSFPTHLLSVSLINCSSNGLKSLQVHLLSPSPQIEKPQSASNISSFGQKISQLPNPIKIQSQAKPPLVSSPPIKIQSHIPSRPATSQYPQETKTQPHSPILSHLRRLLLFPTKELPNFPHQTNPWHLKKPPKSKPPHIPILPKATLTFSRVQKLSTPYPTIGPNNPAVKFVVKCLYFYRNTE